MSAMVHPAARPVEITDTLSGHFLRLTEETTAEDVLSWLQRPEIWGRDIEQCPGLLGDARVWAEVAVTPWSELDDSWAYSPHQHLALA